MMTDYEPSATHLFNIPFKVVYDKNEIDNYGKPGKHCFTSAEGNKFVTVGKVPYAGSRYAPAFTTNDLKVIRKMLSYLPKEAIMSETGEAMSIKYDKDNVTCIYDSKCL